MYGLRSIATGTFVAMLALAVPSVGHAEGASPEAQAAFGEGKRLYDAGAKAEAVEKFKEAYRLSKNDLLLYNVALVYDEIGDRPLALHYYSTFLDKSKGNDKAGDNRKLAAERVVSLKKSLATTEATATSSTPEPTGSDPEPEPTREPRRRKGGGTPLQHEPVENARAGKPIVITAYAADDKWDVTLFYRPSGREAFTLVPMSARDGEETLAAKIPATAGSSVHYYIEAKDASDKLVGNVANSGSPNVIMLEGGDDERVNIIGEGDDDGEPRGPQKKSRVLVWSVTAGSAVLLAGAVGSYMSWVSYQHKLNDELEDCTTSPCTLDSYEQDLKDGRDRWKTMTYVTTTLGIVGAGVAGYLWYRDLKSAEPRAPRVAGVPVVGDGFVGGAALFEF